MAELDSISVSGFKSINSLDKLDIRSLNIVIGPNGSGKSNFIGVFSFLNEIREGRLQDYVGKAGGADRILHFGSKMTPCLKIHVSFNGGVNQYEIQLEPTAKDELYPSKEIVGFWDKSRYSQPYNNIITGSNNEAGIASSQTSRVAPYVQKHLGSWRVYHFHDTGGSSPMKKTADINDNRYLRPDGSNLAAFLYYLKEQHETTYKLIRGTIQRVAPFFGDFILLPQRLNPNKIRLEWQHKNSDSYFDASSLSDGTLRFIALATLLLQPVEYLPSVILVDEPELGLHPFAITILSSLMKAASRTSQVILSTQSALLLDHFAPEDVLVADRVEGGTKFTRLDSASIDSWLEQYSLGQLWEKNELGGRPGVG